MQMNNGISLRQILERGRNRADNDGEFFAQQHGHGDGGNANIRLWFGRNGDVRVAYSPWCMALPHVHDFSGNIPDALLDVAHIINSDTNDAAAQYYAMAEIIDGRTAAALTHLWEPWVLKELDLGEEAAAA